MEKNQSSRVVIFDWDGTLSDSCADIVNCLHGAAVEVGLPELSRHQYSQIIGLGLSEAIAVLYPHELLVVREGMADAYRRQHIGLMQKRSPDFFEGAFELLQSLKSKGFLLAVATGKSRKGLDRALQASELGAVFDITRCADETASKPNPKMLFEILSELNVGSDQAFMVGDTVFDLDMARNANILGIGITHGVHSREQLVDAASLAVVDRLSDVLPVIQRQYEPQENVGVAL